MLHFESLLISGKLICGWKKLFEKSKEDCLVLDHLLNLSSMKEAFLSLCFP